MDSVGTGRARVSRLFAAYAAVSLVGVLALGGVLLQTSRQQADQRGLLQAGDEATLIGSTGISPLLDGKPLALGLSADERAALSRHVNAVVADGRVLRLRLRGLDGRAVYSSAGGKLDVPVDDEALDAASGEDVARLTTFDGDTVPGGGVRAVEAYQPLSAGPDGRRVGVLEVYLPYDRIATDIAKAQRLQTTVLGVGLLVLWLLLLAVTGSVTRRLRRQVAANAFLAMHDALTGMPNRAQFTEDARSAVAAATAELSTVVALVDLDRFKEVNDTLGHAIGDRLLVTLGARLTAAVREGDLVARLGGDEFGIVLPGLRNLGEAAEVLGRVRSALAEPLVIDDLPLSVEASVGFASAPSDGTDLDVLLAEADVAMYVAKRRHLGVVHHTPQHDRYDATRLRLVAELGDAINRGELVLHYQPKTDLRTGRVTAVEALVRWQHPERGLLFPDSFLPAVEQTDLVEPLTRWVLRTATLALADLDPTGTLVVAVNVSARSLGRGDFAEEVLAVLADTGTDPGRVILEITETALLADPTRAAVTLGALTAAGVRISIDDFGAGQTSLGYLADLPVSELKIDKAFVLAMHSEPRNAAIVRSVIDLGHNLGFSVTAEGVETSEALADLTAANCDLVQGYYLGRPVPLELIKAQLVDRAVVATRD